MYYYILIVVNTSIGAAQYESRPLGPLGQIVTAQDSSDYRIGCKDNRLLYLDV